MSGVEVSLKCTFAADRFRLGLRDDRTLIYAVRSAMKPIPRISAETIHQKLGRCCRKLPDGVNIQTRQFFGRFRADAVDLLGR